VNLTATVNAEGQTLSGTVIKISPGFVVFSGHLPIQPGTTVEMQVAEIGRPLKARFVEIKDGGAYLQLPLNHEHLNFMSLALAKFNRRAA
jgi:hypothetical protein